MKKYFVLFCLVFFSINLDAASLDGTTNIVYQSNHYVFSDGDSATGFVKLENGFTVPENSTVIFNVPCLISGGIDLRTTGILKLDSDLYLDSSVTLSSGGYIYGGGKTIYLGGDLSFPDDVVLTFSSSGIIDGQGHSLVFGNDARILIDNDVTVTLINLTVKNNSISQFAIQCLTNDGQLALDDVSFAFNGNYIFSMGKMFIHNDVIFTGTSKFIYESSEPSYIQPHSVLYFDHNTIFDYSPNSTRNDLINLIDETASIYLNGATLQTTDTGIRLTKGRLILDNKVTLSNAYIFSLIDLTSLVSRDFGSYVSSVNWSPDGKYLAVGGNNGTSNLVVYGWNGSALVQKDVKDFGNYVRCVNWSFDGKYLAVGGNNGASDLVVYEWNGSILIQKDVKAFGVAVCAVHWSSDGKYLAVGGDNNPNDIIIYEWDGSTLTQKDTEVFTTSYVYSVNWSPDGKYLAACGYNGSTDLIVYEWNGSTLTQKETKDFAGGACSVNWSPDGKYLAVGGSNGSSDLIVYEWNGSTLVQKYTRDFGSYVFFVNWSCDGKYLAVGGSNGTSDLVVYEWNGSTLIQKDAKSFGSSVYSVNWSFDGKYLAVGGSNGSSDLIVYRVNYNFVKNNSTFNNSIIFGDSSKGSDYDLDVNILSGARVEVAGKVWDNSAS